LRGNRESRLVQKRAPANSGFGRSKFAIERALESILIFDRVKRE